MRATWLTASIAVCLLAACAGSSSRMRGELDPLDFNVPAQAVLKYSDFHAVDSQRIEQLQSDGPQAFNTEMRKVGSSRSSRVSPGPELLPSSYLTHWNDYMLRLTKARSEITPPGSELRTTWRELSQLGSDHLIFSFVFLTRKNRDFRRMPVVASNGQDIAIRCTISGQESLDLASTGVKQPEEAAWRIAGRLTCPLISNDGRPLINPNAGFLRVSLFPGNSLQFFQFHIPKPNGMTPES